MYYQNYDDYMRNELGYLNPYQNYYSRNQYTENQEEINKLYPDIYQIIYPVICKVCSENLHRPLTRDLVLNLTDEIYEIIENDSTNENRNKTTEEPRKDVSKTSSGTSSTTRSEEKTILHSRNTFLKDLIRILILRELSPNRPNRPRPPRPGERPPFPGPGNPPGRPPMFPPQIRMNQMYDFNNTSYSPNFSGQNQYMNSLYQDDIYQF